MLFYVGMAMVAFGLGFGGIAYYKRGQSGDRDPIDKSLDQYRNSGGKQRSD